MAYLGTDFVSTVPADNTAAKLGASWIRDIKTRLKAWATVLFDLETGLLKSAVVTSANLAAPSGAAAAATSGAPSLGAFTFTQCEFNAQGQLVKGQRGGLVAADYAAASVGTAALVTSAVTQLILADAEVTAEKFQRPRKWVRYTTVGGVISDMDRSGTTVTATRAAHGLALGDSILISGSSNAALDGAWTVTGSTDSYVNTFTFTTTTSGTITNATGTLSGAIKAGSFALTGSQATVALSGNGALVTATAVGHGYTSGSRVRISGSTAAGFNGDFTVTVTGNDTFTYASNGTTSTGTTKTQKLLRDCVFLTVGTGLVTLTFVSSFKDEYICVTATAKDPGTSVPMVVTYDAVTTVGVTLQARRSDTRAFTDCEVCAVFQA